MSRLQGAGGRAGDHARRAAGELSHLRSLAARVAPGLLADRDRRRQLALRERLGLPERAAAWAREHGDVVAAGPFAGLRYPLELLRRADAPLAKLQGAYEQPLQPSIAELIERLGKKGGAFVDLGCADGYYAAGVAYAVGCDVQAYDLSRSARAATRALAAANGVAVDVYGRATIEFLRKAGFVRALLCDIEGAEAELLTREVAETLRDTFVIVELHGESDVPERFATTHDVEIVETGAAAEELRTEPTPWLVARPKLL